MKWGKLAIGLVTLLAFSRASAGVGADLPPRHASVSFSMVFDTPKQQTAAAFGPLAEAKWAPDFQPRFVYPERAEEIAGAVFTTPDGALWLLHDFAPSAGLVQYVILDPGSLAVTLTIRAEERGQGTSVTMTYDMVALDDAGAGHIAKMQRHSAAMAQHMQAAVQAFLVTRGDDNPPRPH